MTELRWRLADDDGGQGALFEQEVEGHVGRREFRGMEFLHVQARRVINEVPKASRMPFRWTINAYRGCSHACQYGNPPDLSDFSMHFYALSRFGRRRGHTHRGGSTLCRRGGEQVG